METYTVVKELENGLVAVRRTRDGKTATVKRTWLKPRPGHDDGTLVPASRVKAIRLDGFVEWE